MNNLYYVQSPLQLFSAIEASKESSLGNIFLIKVSAPEREEHNQQLGKLIGEIANAQVITIKWIKNGIVRKVVNNARLIMLILAHRNKIDSFYFGEFRSPSSHILRACIKARRDILLDDGAVTLHIQKYWISNGKFYFNPDSRLLNIKNRLFETIFAARLSSVKAPHLYSIFDLEQYLLPGQVNYRERKPKRQVDYMEGEVYFFGSKYSESGLMSLSDELYLIEGIFQFFLGKQLIYVAHRDDSEEKLSKIQEIGYSVKKLGTPAEVYFKNLELVPEIIAGFWTTVLYSLSCEIAFKEVFSFDNTIMIRNRSELKRAEEIYEYYDNVGISIIRSHDYVSI